MNNRLPLVVYVLALGTFLMITTEFVAAGLLPDISEDFGVSIATAGLTVTAFALGMIVGAPTMSMLALRIPKRLTLMLALALFAIGHIAGPLAPTFDLLLVSRFITALATGAFWAAATVVATRAAGPSQQAQAMGVVNAGGMLATALGVPIGAFATHVAGWQGTFWTLAVLSAALIPLLARYVAHEPRAHDAPTVRGEIAGLNSHGLWLALAACATTTGGVLAAYSFIAPLLSDAIRIDDGALPLVLAGFGIGALIGSIAGGRIGDARPIATIIVGPAVSTLLLLGIAASTSTPAVAITLITLLGLFGLGSIPALIALAVRFAERAPTLGSALSVSAFNFGTAAGTAIAAASLHSNLGARGPVLVGVVIVALTLVPAMLIARSARRQAPTRTSLDETHTTRLSGPQPQGRSGPPGVTTRRPMSPPCRVQRSSDLRASQSQGPQR